MARRQVSDAGGPIGAGSDGLIHFTLDVMQLNCGASGRLPLHCSHCESQAGGRRLAECGYADEKRDDWKEQRHAFDRSELSEGIMGSIQIIYWRKLPRCFDAVYDLRPR